MDLEEMNRNVIEEFRSNGGKVTGQFDGIPILLLHCVGAKSGKQHTKPLAYTMDGDRYVIIASFAGSPTHPPWYHNLVANPELDIEVGSQKLRVRADVTAEPERTNLYESMAAQIPVFADYKKKTERVIPVFTLTPV
jgi:deazaflavin-dependent oxidoreductase (nitroreductase family)